MNCQKLEEVVNDIAREQLITVRLRAEAFAHTRECDQCARRFEDERRLTARLRGLAVAIGSLDAAETVPARLLEAFDRRQSPAARRFARVRRGSWIAIAAALLMVVGVLGAMIIRWREQVPVIPPAESSTATTLQAQPEKPDSPRAAPVIKANSGLLTATLHGRKPVRRREFNESTASGETASHQAQEIATDFFLINYGAVPLAEGGRVVRLLVPRSSMAKFGLPVNMDRANEPVKADIILGLDNLPQAIRFVQEMASADTPNSKQPPAPTQTDPRKQRKEKKS